MSRVLKTLSNLSHFGTEEPADGGFRSCRAARAGAAMGVGIGLGAGVSSASSIIIMMSGVGPPAAAGRSPPPDSSSAPSLSGLKNHGITCFMSAVLQCLSNTELFTEFLALEQYRQRASGGSGEAPDPLGQKDKACPSNGVLFPARCQADTGGEVTKQLASLVRALWTSEYTSQLSREFKAEGLRSLTGQGLIQECLELEGCLSGLEDQNNWLGCRLEGRKMARSGEVMDNRVKELEREIERLGAEGLGLLMGDELYKREERLSESEG